MIGLQYVNTSLSTLANPEDPESESEGWILEKTVKETFTDIMATMKAMGQGNLSGRGGKWRACLHLWVERAPPTHQTLAHLPEVGELWDAA